VILMPRRPSSPFMNLRFIRQIEKKHSQGRHSSSIWWSRCERLENFRSQLLVGLKFRSTGY